ncbi:MAG: hypothetical protein E4H14_16870 [Candidatus Thorarchaeota archaeon]|nr:MAG: hypothetical protein E4H14_16870 [Candidatus Thorarchaeota archaeon]
MNIDPQFPFGFGLSYTEFELEDVRVSKAKVNGIKDQLTVSVDVTNTGLHGGSEIIQVYASQDQTVTKKPPRELVGFGKVLLEPKQKKSLAIPIQASDLSFYDVKTHGWRVVTGEMELLVGNSSRCDFLSETVVCFEK